MMATKQDVLIVNYTLLLKGLQRSSWSQFEMIKGLSPSDLLLALQYVALIVPWPLNPDLGPGGGCLGRCSAHTSCSLLA